MRGYGELLDFMRDLSDGVQEYLPEELRTAQLSLNEIVDQWITGKSYLAIRSLQKDIASYVKKSNAGDFSVDELFFISDLVFTEEMFGCEEAVLLTKVLEMLKLRVEERRLSVLTDIQRWLRSW
ncbi:hypothetical protein [Pseudomonas huanghezhanensis]|uniref:hypothetical protein n=1 Tax=Pseudomonas huanghezhanensis TaxID=3002903 RepID=UPI00228699FB|nr:hypothetical protein [Pseudomonas sp. BSw22131]